MRGNELSKSDAGRSGPPKGEGIVGATAVTTPVDRLNMKICRPARRPVRLTLPVGGGTRLFEFESKTTRVPSPEIEESAFVAMGFAEPFVGSELDVQAGIQNAA